MQDIVFASDRVGSDIKIWRMGPGDSDPRQIASLSNRDTSRQGTRVYSMNPDGSGVR